MATLHDIRGIIGTSFQIGYGAISCTLTVKVNPDVEGELLFEISAPVDMGDRKITTTYRASSDEDLCNLKTVLEKLSASETAIYQYVDGKIAEMTGGTTGNNVMLLPQTLEINNLTPDETYEAVFGTLERMKFIDRIIFEVLEPFSLAEATSTLYFSVGTTEDPELFVPKTPIDQLQSTLCVEVFKTITADTEIKLFGYYVTDGGGEEPVDPPYDPNFVQRVDNNHEDVSVSLGSDASGNVVNITLTGDNLQGSVLDTDTFGEVTGNYMDFAVNIPLHTDGSICHYRVVQQNPALAYYDGKDEFISNQDGVWTKDKTYTIEAGTQEFLMSFLLTQSAGDEDYAHLYIYDLDAEEPENAFRSYHIKNELNFAAEANTNEAISLMSMEEEEPELQFSYRSSYESAFAVQKVGQHSYKVTLAGQIHNQYDELLHSMTEATNPGTSFTIHYLFRVKSSGVRVLAYNPNYQANSSLYKTLNGVTYLDQTVYDQPDGFYIDLPIGENRDYPIVVIITDLLTNEYDVVFIENKLTFGPSEEEEEQEYQAVAAKSAVMPMAYGDTGSMRVRILSF